MTPRDYQAGAIASVIKNLEEHGSTLVVLPTGTGKTIVFSHVADHYANHGRILILAHREELIRQAADKVGIVTGHLPAIEMASERSLENPMHGNRAQIVVSTIQTQIAGKGEKRRMHRFDPDDFSLVVCDEAHHYVAKSFRAVIKYYQQNKSIKILGVTATPDRTDKLALGQVFSSVAYDYGIDAAIDDGWLVPISQQMVHVESLDLSAVKTVAGDFNQQQLSEVMESEKNLWPIAHPTWEMAAGRRTLLFATSVEHAKKISEILNRFQPGCAGWLCGKHTPEERAAKLRSFRNGEFHILCNVALFTEGFDDPGIEVIAMARPTKSRTVYAQQLGRGTRPLPGVVDIAPEGAGGAVSGDMERAHGQGEGGPAQVRRDAIRGSAKPSLLVIDFAGNSGKHKLVTSADILGGKYSDDEIELAKQAIGEQKGPVDVQAMLAKVKAEKMERHRKAEEDARREAERRRHITVKANYSTSIVDPFGVIGISYNAARDTGELATEKQVAQLEQLRVDRPGEYTKQQATRMIGELFKRRAEGKCTFKQAKTLQRYGYPTDLSFKQASEIMNQLSANGWRRLAVDPVVAKPVVVPEQPNLFEEVPF